MAPAVIDALEMVQVAQNQAKALTGRQCMHLAMLQFILTGMPVQQARQLVAEACSRKTVSRCTCGVMSLETPT
jgi:hypothetical protein